MSKQSITHAELKTQYTCDICGMMFGSRHCQCCMCNRDLCRNHAIYDPRDGVDYPDKFCHTCWNAGESFRQQERVEMDRHDTAMNEILEQWRAASKAAVQKEKGG